MNNSSYRKNGVFLLIVFLFLLETPLSWANPVKEVPVKGMVNLVDLGADTCLPCKMMAPILEKLEKVYRGKAAIIFIDVSKFPDQAKRFGIRVIPTQIFFDKKRPGSLPPYRFYERKTKY
jgi:thioredoxin 1